jgi:hypothetical protein
MGGRNRVSPVFNSEMVVVPSGNVYLTLIGWRSNHEGIKSIRL